MIPVFFAYKRSQLLLKNVLNTIELDVQFEKKYKKALFSEILLVHDGVRDAEDMEHRRLHNRTLELCRSLEQTHSKIKLIQFNNNVGLTLHAFRVFSLLSTKLMESILIEEDKFMTFEGMEFLRHNSDAINFKNMVDLLPKFNHISKSRENLSSLHTDGGNVLYGAGLIETAREIWAVKDKFQVQFEKNLHLYLSQFLSGYGLKRALLYYSNGFSWGLYNVERPDALICYSLVLTRELKISPLSRITDDYSGQDSLGKNVNTLPIIRRAHEYRPIKIWNTELCKLCEKKGVSERVSINRHSSARRYLNFKFNSLTGSYFD
jgi:hypothetical protein